MLRAPAMPLSATRRANLAGAVMTADLLVNATPVGTAPAVDDTPWPGARFDGRFVYDLVYNPPVTRLLREAATAGCATLGGLDMLVAQAQQQFLLWTGRLPDAGVMRAAAARDLEERGSRPDIHRTPATPSALPPPRQERLLR